MQYVTINEDGYRRNDPLYTREKKALRILEVCRIWEGNAPLDYMYIHITLVEKLG